MRLKKLQLLKNKKDLANLPEGKILINTINAHSYNTATTDIKFNKALKGGDFLIPDGIGIVLAMRFLKGERIERITGWDLFIFEMSRIEKRFVGSNNKGKVFFLGSSHDVLNKIQKRAAVDYPSIDTYVYSPPYKAVFTEEENSEMINIINEIQPDLLWIGMTAPKQEKWAFENYEKIAASCHIGTVGAVFDFYANTVKRAPFIWQMLGLEWFFRLLMEPKRLFARYIIGNYLFCIAIIKEKYNIKDTIPPSV